MMEEIRKTRASAKRLPAERTTRNSRKTPAYLCKPLMARTRTRSLRSTTPSGAHSASQKHETTDIIESSQEPLPPSEPQPTADVFVIERDTCQMSPLLFDSDSDSAASSPQDTTVIIPNNQQALVTAEKPSSSPASSSEPLLDLPTSTTETDTDVSQCQPPSASVLTTPQRRRHTFRSFKCTPARLTRLTALRNNRPAVATATVTPAKSTAARMAPPPKVHNQQKRVTTSSAASRTKYPSSSSEFSVASDISAVMQARRNVIRTDSDADNTDAVRVEAYEPARPPPALNPCSFDDLHLRLLPQRRREPSPSQELQIIEHRNVIITLSSDTDNHPATPSAPQSSAAANRTRRNGGRTSEDPSSNRRSPDLFDTFDDEFDAVPALPRRSASFFERPRCGFFARLSTQAAAALTSSTPIRTPPQQRRDESIDIFGDNATFIETPRRLTELEDYGPRLTTTTTTKTPTAGVAASDRGVDNNNSTMANTTSMFEITKNDVFPHLIRVNSDSDMSPIKMSEEEQLQQKPSSSAVPRQASAFALPAKMPNWKENFVDPDILNTGVIGSSQDQQQRTPLKLTLYERLCRTDPSRQFSGPGRRKAISSSVRTPDRKPRRRKSVTGSAAALLATATPVSTSPESKRRQRLQKWSSDERAAPKPSTSKAKWTGRRLEDYFAKTGTTSSGASCSAAPAKTAVVAPVQMLILSSDDERS